MVVSLSYIPALRGTTFAPILPQGILVRRIVISPAGSITTYSISTYYAVGSTGRTTRGPTLHASRARLGNHSARLTLRVWPVHMIPAVHKGMVVGDT